MRGGEEEAEEMAGANCASRGVHGLRLASPKRFHQADPMFGTHLGQSYEP